MTGSMVQHNFSNVTFPFVNMTTQLAYNIEYTTNRGYVSRTPCNTAHHTAHAMPRPAKRRKHAGQPPSSWARRGVAIKPRTVPALEAA